MQAFKNYLNELSKKDRMLLLFSICLLSFVSFKFLLLDTLKEKNKKLTAKVLLIQEQENILSSIQPNASISVNSGTPSNKIITTFLKSNSISQNLKQIRTTNSGEQRYEIENIEFSKLVELFAMLKNNGSNYSSVQIKNRKSSGIVNAVITLKN